MSWYDDNAAALQAANIPESAARDFISRNEGDYSRILSALGPDYARREQSSGGSGGGSGGGLPSASSTPWTRPFSASLGALPADLMQPITERYTSAAMPTDLLDRWDRQFEAPDPSKLLENPVVQARLALGRDAAEKSAMAGGTLFTGGFAKGLNEFGQQVATEEYDNIYNRARGEFLDAFGIFSGDKSRRQSVWNDQDRQGLNAFTTNTGLTLADRGQRANIYGQQWDRDWTNYMGDYGIFKENQTIPFGMSTEVYRLGQGDRQIAQGDRSLDENLRMGAFNRNRLSDLDQFAKYTYQDSSFWDRIFRGIEAGKN